MKTLTLNLEQLAVDSFEVAGSGHTVLADSANSNDTICTACPSNQYSCLFTCQLRVCDE